LRAFLVKGVIFIVILIVILSGINYKYVSTEYYSNLNNVAKFRNVPYNLEIVNLGTSHAMQGIGYDGLEGAGYNFALDAQILYYDLAILKQFKLHLKKGARVIIPVSYISLYMDNYGEKYQSYQPRYYQFLKPENIKDFKVSEYIRFGLFPIMSAGDKLKYLYQPSEAEQYVRNEEAYPGTIQALEKEAKETVDRHIGFKEQNLDSIADNLESLEGIVRLCQENDFTPILVTMPVTHYYRDGFSEEFKEEFYHTVNNIKDKYNVRYLDYSFDETFANDINLFFDSAHLNKIGRERFSELLLKHDLN